MNHPLGFFSFSLSQPTPLTISPSPADSPWFSTPPSDSACGCSPTCTQRWGISLLRRGSVRWQISRLRAALLAPGFRVVALFCSRIMQSLIPFRWHLRSAGHEIRRVFKKKKFGPPWWIQGGMAEARSSRLSGGVVSGRAKWTHDDEVGRKWGRWRRGRLFWLFLNSKRLLIGYYMNISDFNVVIPWSKIGVAGSTGSCLMDFKGSTCLTSNTNLFTRI